MKIKNLIIVSASAILLSSCAVTTPVTVTNNPVGNKIGTSTTTCYFTGTGSHRTLAPFGGGYMYNGIMSNKNFGIVEAAKNGKITKIGAVDIKITYKFFCVKKELIVSGE